MALDGHAHTGIDNGSLGRSANGKAPVVDASGRSVGEVSVGILESEVGVRIDARRCSTSPSTRLSPSPSASRPSLLLARAIKRLTFGLEPAEIAALVQEREAMLHGIREGVIAVDAKGAVNVLNDEARRLLGIESVGLGQRVEDVVPAGRLRRVLTGEVDGVDVVAVTDEHLPRDQPDAGARRPAATSAGSSRSATAPSSRPWCASSTRWRA